MGVLARRLPGLGLILLCCAEYAKAAENVDIFDLIAEEDLSKRVTSQAEIGYGIFPNLAPGLPGLPGLINDVLKNPQAAKKYLTQLWGNYLQIMKDLLLPDGVCPRYQDDLKYFLDMLVLGEVGYVPFFSKYSEFSFGHYQDQDMAAAPGICTFSYTTHEKVRESLAAFPKLWKDGMFTRSNELGLLRLNDLTFEYCSGVPDCGISLGVSFKTHSIVRPLLDTLYGDGQAPGSIFANTGNKWSKADFVASASAFLAGKNTVKISADAAVWTIKELHKVALGIDLPGAQAEGFIALQGGAFLLSILPPILVPQVAQQLGTSISEINQGKLQFLHFYKTILSSPPFDPLFSGSTDKPGDIEKLARGLLDSFLFAGGLSVPTVIKSGLAAYFTGLTPNDGSFNATNPSDLTLLALESIRLYPPVLGFPYFDSETGVRHAPLPGLSGYDTNVHGGDALEFRIRGDVMYYHERSLNFADAALPVEGDSSTNRVCPARSMAIAMVTAFWEALDASQFCVAPGSTIEREEGPSFWSDFTITKTCNQRKLR